MQRLGTILTDRTDPIHDLDRFSLTPAGEAALDAATKNEAPAVLEVNLETNAAVESVRQAYDGPASGQPKPEWVRGVCPQCGGPVVSNCYYVGGKGFLVVWECWGSLAAAPTCSYKKVL